MVQKYLLIKSIILILKNGTIKKLEYQLCSKENSKFSYENISYSYEIFNEVIIWGLMNYPDLNKFFGKNIEIHGTKVSFDKNVFQKVNKEKQFEKLENIKSNSTLYKKLNHILKN